MLVAFVLAQTALPPLTSHTSLVSNLASSCCSTSVSCCWACCCCWSDATSAKVIFERRRGLIGSKFQVRLVLGFIAVAMVPSLFLLYVSGAFLHADVDSWFNPEYERVLEDSLDIAKIYYLNSGQQRRALRARDGRRGRRHGSAASRAARRAEAVHRAAPAGIQPRHYRGVLDSDRKLLLLALSPRTPTGIGVSPDSPILVQTLTGHAMTRTDPFGSADIIRGSAPIFSSPEADVVGAVVVDYYLPKSLAKRAASISRDLRGLLPVAHAPAADPQQLHSRPGVDWSGGGAVGELVRDVSGARHHRSDQAAGRRHPGDRARQPRV